MNLRDFPKVMSRYLRRLADLREHVDTEAAARQILSDQTPMTAITKACYAPSEQYDKNGRQGPWTDVYALCATLYRCVTGAPPESAIQRMFLDELKAPSQLGIAIAPACEEVIMKGLQLRPEKRWQSMDELAQVGEEMGLL